MERRRFDITGLVQGVGFRPFIYKLAHQYHLTGWVKNTGAGVQLEVQGDSTHLNDFIDTFQTQIPQNASITEMESWPIPLEKEKGFSIKHSDDNTPPHGMVLPDLATCEACLEEITTPGNRRYRYPFTNCTLCGPRFSIVEKLPYDRKHTTMKLFTMCQDCQREYNDPADRRFHAQPNGCPQCGPKLTLWNANGDTSAVGDESLLVACEKVCEGAILAIKGIGGFQLIVDATNKKSIERLRQRKSRPEKPFAMMYPNLDLVKKHCHVSQVEEKLLLSREAPIVLLSAKAPGNPYFGVMLPYSPLHHLLLHTLNFPVIATSGNRAEEPICIDETEALMDLKGIADYFLVHNRPIARYVDDSIVQVVCGRQLILRRSRGYASIPFTIPHNFPPSLAVGGQLKNTFAAARGNKVYLSQHIGDLENQKAFEGFSREVDSLLGFYGIEPEIVISDYHPDYSSTKYAINLKKPHHSCQHHVAHVFSCIAEHQVAPPLLGVSWDGTGYGLDGTVWGGEFIVIRQDFSYERAAYFRPFPLPCGEKAIREPRLSAIGMLFEAFGEEALSMKELPPLKEFTQVERDHLRKILASGFRSPSCSSLGRIFDGIASLLSLRQIISFEGQAAMELEFLCEEGDGVEGYPFRLKDQAIIDWVPMLRQIIENISQSVPNKVIATRFHHTLVDVILHIAKLTKQKKVALSGGVFQNKALTEMAVGRLTQNGLVPYWNQKIPPNDGGISLGQIYSLCGKKDKTCV